MPPAQSHWSGIVAMVLATGLFVVSDSLMKLTAQGLQPFQVLFMRGFFGLVSCSLLLVATGQMRQLGGALHWRAILRAMLEAAATFFYMAALSAMPIADAIAIGQTAPLLVIVAMAVIFRERIGAVRLALVCTGFLGALLVAQPGGAGLSPAALYAFVTAMMVATRDLLTRGTPSTIPTFVVLTTTTVVLTLATGCATLIHESWMPPSLDQWVTMAASGFIVTLGQMAIFLSYRRAPAGIVAPYYYSFTVWAVIGGFLVWGEVPNGLAITGMVMIVASGLALLFVRSRRTQEAIA
ncbi:DMT family transporter [Labrys sp. ZIDIC5]|uniref:DMT family transporter n=1 Tax=Labrys sedimenti TaxID=3106036 RepID=UPI002ACAE1CE|nr:DMT family transporter [Labrys sp. ZIDIC5]MDZ5450087.1 DMT family transporter [Labrys sp. ZIDIC5]